MRTLLKKLKYILWAALYAFAIFNITRLIYHDLAGEDVLIATILNIVMIVFFVILEKIEGYIIKKLHEESGKEKSSIKNKMRT